MAKKQKNQQHNKDVVHSHFELRKITPLTANQAEAFKVYDGGANLMLSGAAGTGKTFISLYLSLMEILSFNTKYDRIKIIRSVVPSRDMGFLPGSIKDKIQIYESPYKEICNELFGKGDGYEILKMKGLVEFTSTSFLRGNTFNNTIIILDEAQNLEWHEINTVMTRIGENSRVIVCGDFKQTDLVRHGEKTGIYQFINVINRMKSFSHIEFDKNDIVRSGMVKEFLTIKEELNY